MSEIRIIAGSWEAGTGSYLEGLLHLPNGDRRGLEEIVDLEAEDGPARRRTGIAGGLRSALNAAGPLPRPLDLAAAMVGLGLGALGGDLHAVRLIRMRFSDGARAVIEADSATAALIRRDHAVIRQAMQRQAASSADAKTLIKPPMPILALPAPSARFLPGPAHSSDPVSEREIPSIFEYEKRKGRLRRLAVAKARDEA